MSEVKDVSWPDYTRFHSDVNSTRWVHYDDAVSAYSALAEKLKIAEDALEKYVGHDWVFNRMKNDTFLGDNGSLAKEALKKIKGE